MPGLIWSKQELSELSTLWLARIPSKEIAAKIGRSRTSIQTKASDLRLPERRWKRAEDSRAGMRPCMCCEAPFYSAGIHNRLCVSCRNGAH